MAKKIDTGIKKGTVARFAKFLFAHNMGRMIVVIVCIVLTSLSSSIASIFIQRLIDQCITPGLSNGWSSVLPVFTKIMFTMGVIYVIGIIAAATYSRIMARVTQGTLKEFRTAMFDKMQTLPIRYFDTHAHGDVMSTYTNDVDAVRQMISQSIPMMIQSGLTIILLFVIMLRYSFWLTIIVVVFLALMMFITKRIGGASSKYMMAQQRSLAKEEGFVEEMMSGARVIKVFCHEEESKKEFAKINQQLFEDGDKAFKFGNVLMPVLNNVGNIMYVLVALVGAIMVFAGATNVSLAGVGVLTIGVVVSFLGMARQMSQTLMQISVQVSMVAMGIAGVGRIFELMDEEPEFDEGYVTLVRVKEYEDGTLEETDAKTGTWAWKNPNAKEGEEVYRKMQGDIRMKDVDFGYTEEKQILHNISLFAKPGQKIAFVGATGAGKTTITNLINRFYDIQSGIITYDGIDIKTIRKPDLRRSLGIVLQEVNLFTGTVMDNIRYGKLDATDEECIAAAKLANADSFITRLPDGYNTMLTGNGASLSQGQRQLISIARAAVADPPAMILDEATSSIDTRTEALVQEGMDNLMKGRTVFVIAHRLSTVRNSEAIMVLDHGNIIERGDHDELIAQKGTYYQLYTGSFELE
ncbi:ABC transporter ATP-binding protein [Eubacterium oxidoreducens]|uniref:ATP-binding cassette, subfamily B n=1 Tax=Eubacterium oxidoreducens TaxID=1732 RepID=A0A1G6BCL6_EUBOX|nr:ABC transporter ATP-binding protein [Eubacterium oxidoreducens]SDB18355.1 ATP-binding cassette, subfamily B [Eubacterium oxidoreducens]